MEEKLFEIARSGDKEAFVKLINLYKRKLYVIAKARIDNEEDVKDAIQETLLKSYINIKKVKCGDKFNAWITKILINNCNNILRIKGRTPYSYDELELDKYYVDDSEIISVDERSNLFSLINLLKEDEKLIILMYYSQGYTASEISSILNINENTVRTKLKRGKEKIRNNYNNEL